MKKIRVGVIFGMLIDRHRLPAATTLASKARSTANYYYLSTLTVALVGNPERNFPSRSVPQHANRSKLLERNCAIHGYLGPHRPTAGTRRQATGISALAVRGTCVPRGAPAPFPDTPGYRSDTANAHHARDARLQPRANAQEYEAFVHASH